MYLVLFFVPSPQVALHAENEDHDDQEGQGSNDQHFSCFSLSPSSHPLSPFSPLMQ